MAEICEYFVIKDGEFKLEVGESKTLSFKLLKETKIEEKSILFYICNPTRKAINLKYRVEINNEGADRGCVGEKESAARTIHEVVNKDILKTGDNNIKFIVQSGTGNITFSDVVILCKRDM